MNTSNTQFVCLLFSLVLFQSTFSHSAPSSSTGTSATRTTVGARQITADLERERTLLWKDKLEEITDRAYDLAREQEKYWGNQYYSIQIRYTTTSKLTNTESLRGGNMNVVQGTRAVAIHGNNASLSFEGTDRVNEKTEIYGIQLSSNSPAMDAVLDECYRSAKSSLVGPRVFVMRGENIPRNVLFLKNSTRILSHWNAFTRASFDGLNESRRLDLEGKYLQTLHEIVHHIVYSPNLNLDLDFNSKIRCSLL